MELLTITNKNGMSCTILPYGGIIQSIRFPVEGELVETVLNYADLEDYLSDNFYLGAIVGRYCNRIANGKFRIGESSYQLASNNEQNHLHGGVKGFSKQVWNIESTTTNSISLSYLSSDGEEGYPGNLDVKVSYRLDDKNSLAIDITAKVDKPCPVNLTGHTYFNLSNNSSTIEKNLLKVNAEKFLPIDGSCIPTGELKEVVNTPFDLIGFRELGSVIGSNDFRISSQQGIDHNYVLSQSAGEVSHAASVYCPESKIQLEVSTNMPGLQVYTGNHLSGPFKRYQGLCLEPQYFPDSPNQVEFPSSLLMPDEEYHHRIIYRFSQI
ncbi:MAG: galactose mutarotase [Kangiellaceae bacterium]|nr:galactose mutarotase [Kangiellaceae bacterium]